MGQCGVGRSSKVGELSAVVVTVATGEQKSGSGPSTYATRHVYVNPGQSMGQGSNSLTVTGP